MTDPRLGLGIISLGAGAATVFGGDTGTNASPGSSVKDVIDEWQKPSVLGRLFIISGPSGVGKTTIVSELLELYNTPTRELVLAVTFTTRPERSGEENGVHYYFVDTKKFHQMRDAGGFLETAMVHGHFYGTPRGPVMDALRRGADVVVVIDVQGRERLMGYNFGAEPPQIHSIFIRPEMTEQLRKQLQGRGDSLDVITRRVAAAEKEIARAGEYHHTVISYLGQPHRALAEVIGVFEGVHDSISS